MNVRPAEEQDLERCVELIDHEPGFAFANGEYPDKNFFRIYLEDPYFLVAEETGKIIGFILGEQLKGHVVSIWYFILDKEKRGQGIGSKLFAEYESRLKKIGTEWLLLNASMNEGAIAFYQRHGFHKGVTQIEMLKSLKE